MAYLVMVPGLQLLGGVVLAYIACKLLLDSGEDAAAHSESENSWGAVRTILLADVVMSLDNMLAVAGASRGDSILLAFGLVVSMVMILTSSALIAQIMDRFRWVAYVGTGILAFAAAEMMTEDREVARFFVRQHQVSLNDHWNEWMLTTRPISSFPIGDYLAEGLKSVVSYDGGKLTFIGNMTEVQRDLLLALVSSPQDRQMVSEMYEVAHLRPVPAWVPASVGPLVSAWCQEKWPAECWQAVRGHEYPVVAWVFHASVMLLCLTAPRWWPGQAREPVTLIELAHPYASQPLPVPAPRRFVHEESLEPAHPLHAPAGASLFTGESHTPAEALDHMEFGAA
jgi:threonine/homoserine/homoserine lactone efflux protein